MKFRPCNSQVRRVPHEKGSQLSELNFHSEFCVENFARSAVGLYLHLIDCDQMASTSFCFLSEVLPSFTCNHDVVHKFVQQNFESSRPNTTNGFLSFIFCDLSMEFLSVAATFVNHQQHLCSKKAAFDSKNHNSA